MANNSNPLVLEPNVQLAFIAGFVSHVILQICAAHGVTVDAETAQDLPTALILIGAYVPDVIGKWRQGKANVPPAADSNSAA